MERITIKEIVKWTGGRVKGGQEGSIANIVRDNRQVTPNSLFVALKGAVHDGHEYVQDSLKNGAAAALVQEGNPFLENILLKKDQSLILVPDTQKGLEQIAAAYRQRFSIPVVGVTGSVGKTSCKDITAAALSGGLKVVKTDKNYNNQIGVPLTIFQLEASTQAAVIEMGMNHKGEIDCLAGMVKPQYGIITNIGLSHIENLGSQEGILQAKLEMLNHMAPGGVLYLNGDDPLLYGLKGTLPVETEYFGYLDHNDAKVLETDMTELGRLRLRMVYQGEEYRFVLNTLGEHMAYHALPAVMVSRRLGLEPREIVAGLTQYIPTDLRLQIKTNQVYRIIDDSYNASPDSMESAIQTLVRIPSEARRVVILGDMFELGVQEEEAHRRVGKYLARQEKVSIALFVGSRAAWIYEEAKKNPSISCFCFKTREELEKNVFDIIRKDDIILVKASHGMHLDQISTYILDRK